MEGRDGSSWLEEDPDAARDRHFAAHPEDRDANVVIFISKMWKADEEIGRRGARIVTPARTGTGACERALSGVEQFTVRASLRLPGAPTR